MEDVMEFNLGFVNIVELGDTISDKLRECGVKDKGDLIIYLDKDNFKKVDEDLFYRNRKSEEEEFVPSEGEININFSGVRMIIKEKND